MAIRRFLTDQFKVCVPCQDCGGEIEAEVTGHFFEESFVIESATNLRTQKEMKLTEVQRAVIETRGDERFAEVMQDARDHQREIARELQEVA